MKFTLLASLALGLTGIVNAHSKKPDWDAESYRGHGEALIETWIGRNAINVGDVSDARPERKLPSTDNSQLVTGELYNTLKREIDKDCPEGTNWCDFKGKVHNIGENPVWSLHVGRC